MSWSQAQSSRKASKGRNTKKMINLILIFKIFFSAKDIVKKMKRLVTVWEKHLQRIRVMRDFYPDSIKNSYNSTTKTQPNFLSGRKIGTDISSKKIYK